MDIHTAELLVPEPTLIKVEIAIGKLKSYESPGTDQILLEFGVPKKLVRLIKMCLNETYSKVHIGELLSNKFPIQNGLKQGDTLLPLVFNFALKYVIRKVLENQVSLELNGTHELLVYADILICWAIVQIP
jgi:hypothetical protein